jgi:hypothetical protein
MSLLASSKRSRGTWASLRGLALLALCLGLAAGFFAEVWHGPASPASPASPVTTADRTSSKEASRPAHS